MATLNVGAGQTFTTIAAAVAASRDGDTVLVQAGTYVDDFAIIRTKITLQSVGGLAILQAQSSPSNGKAILTTDADVTIDGFGFTGAAVGDANGAGIRYEVGNLVVRNSVFWDNQEGILGAPNADGTVLIENSEFSHNGAGDGRSHNLYIGAIQSLVVKNSYFHDSVVGHEIKSRARSTTIIGNRIYDNNGDGSYSIDIPDGGVAVVRGNIIEKGVNAPNYTTIHYGGENAAYAGSSLLLADNTIVNDNALGTLLNNNSTAPVTLTGNRLWGFASDRLYQDATAATVTATGTVTLAERPSLDLTSVAPTIPLVIPPKVIEIPFTVTYKTFGIEGAVTASGHILTVGVHAQFTTLAAALKASVDGDTIQVAAGTYVNDLGIVDHKVIIEGVGGIAHFVQSGIGGLPGVLTVNNDVTLRNLAFSGGHGGANSHEGGVSISDKGGNVTIVNSYLYDNDAGIYANPNQNTTVSVYNSEIGSNYNYDKGTHNITLGSIGSFTLKNSYVHGAITGHEISDRACNTVIDGNRIIDGTGISASFLIGLGQGGNAIITNNVLGKGRDATNGVFILVGGEGVTYDNTNVRIDNNVLVSEMINPDHPYTYFINADPSTVAVGPTTGDNNTFVGGIPGSLQGNRVTLTNSHVASSAVLDTTSPVSAALAPAMTRRVAGPNTLTLALSGTAAVLGAQFIVTVDGQAVGGGLIDPSSSSSQTFTYHGTWGAGSHDVLISGINISGGSSALALIPGGSITVDRISLDQASVAPAALLNPWATSYATTLQGTTKLVDFDASYYLSRYADVRSAGTDPLQHYLSTGWKEGRDPSALFSTSYYLARNHDVAVAGINPLQHYANYGWLENRDPSASFVQKVYYAAHPAAAAGDMDPLRLYAESGDTASYADPFVNAAFYHAARPGVGTSQAAVTADYAEGGWRAGFDPSAWFNTNYYLWSNPDVAAAGINPLQHYEKYGWAEGRAANPWFSAASFKAAHPDQVAAGVDPTLAFLVGATATATPEASGYLTPIAQDFDRAFYLAHNADVRAAGVDPLYHFERYGWTEGRAPSATFSVTKYLAANPDVAAAKLDPLLHYVTYGEAEGRAVYPV